MKINIDIDVSNCKLDTDEMWKAISQELEKCAYKIERTAKELVPHEYENTGELKRSINTNQVSDKEFEVSTNVEYAHFIEDGTTPHTIEGNPFLHWSRDGEEFIRSSVNHPGNKPYLYMETAMETHASTLADDIAGAIKL